MKLSVVMAVYNQQGLFENALRCLEGQPFYECIAVDDCSDAPVVAPPWVSLVRINEPHEYRSRCVAMNRGVSVSSGDYLLLLDGDTLTHRDTIESMLKFAAVDSLVTIPAIFFVPPSADPDASLEYSREHGLLEDEDMLNGIDPYADQTCAIMSREKFDEVGGYDESGFQNWGMENHDMTIRLLRSGARLEWNVPRLSTGRRLYCFSQKHDAPRDVQKMVDQMRVKWNDTFIKELESASESDIQAAAAGGWDAQTCLIRWALNRRSGVTPP